MDNKIYSNNYDQENKILTGRIELSVIEKDDGKTIFDLTIEGLQNHPEYTDYILDISNVTETTVASFGYLMKTYGIIKKTAGYMILILKEDILQKFMISNPEMFDFFAVFFNVEDAVKYIKSKR